LNCLEGILNPPTFLRDVLGAFRVDMTSGATGVANGVGAGLLPVRASASGLLGEAGSRGLRRVVPGLVSGVVIRSGVVVITTAVIPGIGDLGTIVRIGISIVVLFIGLGCGLIPGMLAQDIHCLVNGIRVVGLAERILLL